MTGQPVDLQVANTAAKRCCAEVNAVVQRRSAQSQSTIDTEFQMLCRLTVAATRISPPYRCTARSIGCRASTAAQPLVSTDPPGRRHRRGRHRPRCPAHRQTLDRGDSPPWRSWSARVRPRSLIRTTDPDRDVLLVHDRKPKLSNSSAPSVTKPRQVSGAPVAAGSVGAARVGPERPRVWTAAPPR